MSQLCNYTLIIFPNAGMLSSSITLHERAVYSNSTHHRHTHNIQAGSYRASTCLIPRNTQSELQVVIHTECNEVTTHNCLMYTCTIIGPTTRTSCTNFKLCGKGLVVYSGTYCKGHSEYITNEGQDSEH